MAKVRTHEQYIASIYALALKAPGLVSGDVAKLKAIKLTYGAGPDGTRGVTYYNRWHTKACCSGKKHKKHTPAVPFVAICATGQESHVQVCGTVIHELGHVLATIGAGHGPEWHQCCAKLGLVDVQAAGTNYTWKNFEPALRKKLKALPLPNDGAPVQPIGQGLGLWGGNMPKLRPCGAGIGTRGGKSQGKGSKSRLLLWECSCEKPVKVRHSGRDLKATCNICSKPFVLVEGSVPPSQL